MSTSTFIYNLDGAMTAPVGEPFSAIRWHNYTRLPIKMMGVDSSIALRYDSYGRRLHKIGAQAIFYRNGIHHPASDRTKELEKGDEIHHTLVEYVDGAEVVYLFTPAGQTILRREHGYARIARDHLRSVRVEASVNVNIAAHYSAYGEPIITGGQLRRAFAGYEPDAETRLYNANRRLYAPTLRLFVSVDPQLQNASPYPYCNDDPFNNTDPTGKISAATVTSILAAFLLVVTIAATLSTDGALGPLIGPAGVLEGADESGVAGGVAEEASRAGIGAAIGAAMAAGTTALSNGVGLAVQAAQGEHITAWQAVKSMLVEPAIAAAAGGFSGGLLAAGIEAGAVRLVMTVASSLSYSIISTTATAAANGQITSRRGWESIGIQMAIAVGESLLFAGIYMTRVVHALNVAVAANNAASMVEAEQIEEWQRAWYCGDVDPTHNPTHRQARAVRRRWGIASNTIFAYFMDDIVTRDHISGEIVPYRGIYPEDLHGS